MIVEEKPVIPEVTYDGDKEDDEDEDENSIKKVPEEVPLSVGSILTKDTSMDGERMTVSDEESVADADARIASTASAELKVTNVFFNPSNQS